MSKTLSTLRTSLSQAMGDYLAETVTTALTTDNAVVCTSLAKYTTKDDWFNRQWCLITSLANSGQNRKIFDYESPTQSLSVQGAAWASDTAALATFEIHTYNPDNKTRAINLAAKQTFPTLFKQVEWNDTLVMGNHLPNAHFEDWAVTTYPDYYRLTTPAGAVIAEIAETTTAGLTYGGTSSAKVTAKETAGYMSISSNQYPQLLNLMGQTVDFKCWAYPEVANDASIEIYTLNAAGTAQTLTSTTTCPAAKWTQLLLEAQAISDNIQYIAFRFKVATDEKYTYFDNARVTGPSVNEHVLPLDFQLGELSSVHQQTSGNSDDICDDLFTNIAQVTPLFNWTTYSQNGVKYLRLPYASSSKVKLILAGYTPLEQLSADTDTMSINDPQAELLLMFAAFKLCEMEAALASSDDRERLRSEGFYWFNQYQMFRPQIGMTTPQSQTRLRVI